MRVVVQKHIDGGITVASDEPIDVYFVDEMTPNDRVFQMTGGPCVASGLGAVDAVLSDSPIGTRDEPRHTAIKNRIESAQSGRSHLRVVEPAGGN